MTRKSKLIPVVRISLAKKVMMKTTKFKLDPVTEMRKILQFMCELTRMLKEGRVFLLRNLIKEELYLEGSSLVYWMRSKRRKGRKTRRFLSTHSKIGLLDFV